MPGHLTIVQGTASVRAPAIENIYAAVDFNNARRMPKNFPNFHFTWNEIAFPDKGSPLHRQYITKRHNTINPIA
jgi:hypothetical protein